jgi:hypothetical protein
MRKIKEYIKNKLWRLSYWWKEEFMYSHTKHTATRDSIASISFYDRDYNEAKLFKDASDFLRKNRHAMLLNVLLKQDEFESTLTLFYVAYNEIHL